mmetsp:Transcript_39232/g.105245  ORF Transcript_39232/g.105245 Transcript_39232/m.105245 type:complete len:244 (+) Transcript_39232:1248-1979(+)
MHGVHLHLGDLVRHCAALTLRLPPHPVQIRQEPNDADNQPGQRPQALRAGLVGLRPPQLGGRVARLAAVHEERWTLNDEIPQHREDHVPRRVLDLAAEADAGAQQAQVAGRGQLLPVLARVRGPLVPRRALVVQVDPARQHRDGPGQREQHDGAARQRADAHGHLLLRVLPEAGEQHHHAVGHRAQHGEDDAPDEGGDLGDQEEVLAAVADVVGGLEQQVEVGDNGGCQLAIGCLLRGHDGVP